LADKICDLIDAGDVDVNFKLYVCQIFISY